MSHPRYSRQVLFSGIGKEGQARIIASRVALVGCGALGAVQASLLVRAGVGTLRIIDRDFVEESNLQRQILFDEEDVARSCPNRLRPRKNFVRLIRWSQSREWSRCQCVIHNQAPGRIRFDRGCHR